jgi:hypothetical protein
MIDSTKLYKELKAAGISLSGCNSNGVVWDANGNEIQARPDVAEVIALHDPTPIPVESLEKKIEDLKKRIEALEKK